MIVYILSIFSQKSFWSNTVCQWWFFVLGGYAPFLSLSSRKSAYAVAEDTGKAVPGPAHYNVSEAQVCLWCYDWLS